MFKENKSHMEFSPFLRPWRKLVESPPSRAVPFSVFSSSNESLNHITCAYLVSPKVLSFQSSLLCQSL